MYKISLKDLIVLALYFFCDENTGIDKYTVERIVYLFYQLEQFLGIEDSNVIDFSIDDGILTVNGFDKEIDKIFKSEFEVKVNESGAITVGKSFQNQVGKILSQDGRLSDEAKAVIPFFNIIRKYDTELIFSIFLAEPSFNNAKKRHTYKLSNKSSDLSALLIEFKNRINDSEINDYDIISSWMLFVLNTLMEKADGYRL